MAESKIDIERVVREVLARLEAEGGAQSPASDAARSTVPRLGSTDPGSQEGALVLSGRVVTMADVEGRLEGVEKLVVAPQAVLTPSVRDELYRRSVKLVYGRLQAPEKPVNVRLVIAVLGSQFEPGSLVADLQDKTVSVELRRHDCLVAATDEAASEVVKPDTLSVVVSSDPAMALCLANRHRSVRAVWGVDPGRLAIDLESVGANMLVVDPQSVGPFPMKQMVTRFCTRGTFECPQALRKQLG
jgi:hypothetical protein